MVVAYLGTLVAKWLSRAVLALPEPPVSAEPPPEWFKFPPY
jgi:hypothetical protein